MLYINEWNKSFHSFTINYIHHNDMLKLIIKYLATRGIIKRLFFPGSEGELESKDWTGDTGTVVSDYILVDRSKGHWYMWVHDSDKNMWSLYRLSSYAFWKACMASCDAFVEINEIDGDITEPQRQSLESIERRILSVNYELINEIAA